MPPVSEIKLIRTDTTLDLSQKAEKVWVEPAIGIFSILIQNANGSGEEFKICPQLVCI